MAAHVLSLDSLSPGRDLDTYIQTVNAFPVLSPEEERKTRGTLLLRERPRGRSRACSVPSPVRHIHGTGLFGIWAAPGRPDPGRQRWTHEGGQAFQPRGRRAARVLCGALGQGRNARVHPAQLAHRQGRHHQGATQALLQPAQRQEAAWMVLAGGSRSRRRGSRRAARSRSRRWKAAWRPRTPHSMERRATTARTLSRLRRSTWRTTP